MLVASVLGGSHHNVIGPAGCSSNYSERNYSNYSYCSWYTGALTALLSKSSIRYGVGVLPVLAIITGLICIGGFALNLDRYMQFVPLSVLQGFTLGVAVSIAANQMDFGFGLPK